MVHSLTGKWTALNSKCIHLLLSQMLWEHSAKCFVSFVGLDLQWLGELKWLGQLIETSALFDWWVSALCLVLSSMVMEMYRHPPTLYHKPLHNLRLDIVLWISQSRNCILDFWELNLYKLQRVGRIISSNAASRIVFWWEGALSWQYDDWLSRVWQKRTK